MLLSTLRYTEEDGWTAPFPALDSENTLILIFAASSFIERPRPILELSQHYPTAKIVGCSDAGEIIGTAISDKSICVAIMKFEKTKIATIIVDVTGPQMSYAAGKEVSTALNRDDLKAIFVLSEGLNINGSELVKGLNTLTQKNVTITGGLAGDGSQFKQTWVVANGQILKNKIVGVGFYGDHIHIGHGSKGGWDIFGPERRITRSKDNVLFELDGKPALALYKEYLGDKAKGLPAAGLLFPLAIRKSMHDSKKLVRTILAVNEDENSLTFAGDMPKGYLAQLMRANFDRLITGAKEAGQFTLDQCKNLPEGCPLLLVAISCVGRRLLLGERTEEETESVLNIFPFQTQQIGFYSYGEISPYIKGACDLHNQTMTLTSIYEEV